MKKVDLKKDLKSYYQVSAKEISQVEIPAFQYIMIDGEGDPNTSKQYVEAVEALFSVSYAVKFMVKKSAREIDYKVMPLEGLWWADDMSAFVSGDKANWKWTMMIMQPNFVVSDMIQAAIAVLKVKKSLPALDRLRFDVFKEGLCAQILHIGPFSEEGPTIAKLHNFIDAKTCRRDKHHEIYLSDIRRAAPKNWKTIIRQPMQ